MLFYSSQVHEIAQRGGQGQSSRAAKSVNFESSPSVFNSRQLEVAIELLNLSEAPFPQLENGDKNSTTLRGIM